MHASLFAGVTITIALLTSAQDTPQNLIKYTIFADGIDASFVGYGARLTNLYVKDKGGAFQDVAMGFDEGSAYINDTNNEHTYFGAASKSSPLPCLWCRCLKLRTQNTANVTNKIVVGRYANRIKNGTFNLEGQTYHVPTNENDGANSLHGGTTGYDQRNWTMVSHNETSISFMLEDNAFEGFPGRVTTYATYSVFVSCDGPTMTSRLVSIPLDGPTPIMLTTHPYFNLNAFVDPQMPNVNDHTLYLPYTTRYVKVDNILVPTGEIGVVNGESNKRGLLDFTSPATFGESIDGDVQACGFNCTGIDTNFIIDRPPSTGTESTAVKVLTLSSEITGIKFDMYTNQQAITLYTCNKLKGTLPLKKSQQHAKDGSIAYAQQHGCVAIETQGWTDGINHPEWGQMDRQTFSPETLPATMWVKYVYGIA